MIVRRALPSPLLLPTLSLGALADTAADAGAGEEDAGAERSDVGSGGYGWIITTSTSSYQTANQILSISYKTRQRCDDN